MTQDEIDKFKALSLNEQNKALAESCLTYELQPPNKRLYTAGEVNARDTKFGIFNPSVVKGEDGKHMIILRCENSQATWGGHLLHQKACAYLGNLQVNEDKVAVSQPFKLTGGDARCMRHEDWRLFKGLDGELYSNLTSYYYFNRGSPQREPTARTCISRIKGNRLEYLDELNATRHIKMAREEKNWLIFTHDGAYYCLYQVEPFTLLQLDEAFRVRGIVRLLRRQLPRLYGGYMANGANPIYHENEKWGRHYLTICHNFTHAPKSNRRNRTYFHYALILDHDSLQPIGFSSNPIMGGALTPHAGRHNNISYVSGLSVHAGRFYLFYGEGDTHSNVCIIPEDPFYEAIQEL